MRYMVDDTTLFIPLTVVVMGGLLWVVFGRPRAAILAILPVAIAAALTLGLLTGLGYPMSLLTGQGVLTTLILVIGLADGVHLLNRYDEDVAASPHRPRMDALRITVGHVGSACLLTSLTTAVGFLALAIADVPAVHDFGLFGAAGIFFAYLGAVVLLPALLVILERRRPATAGSTATSAALDRLLAATARFVIARPRTILASALVLLAAAAASIPSARIDNGITRDLMESSPPIQAIRFLEERLGGVYPLDILFGGGEPDSIKDLALLEAVDRIADGLEAMPTISKVNSPVEYIMKMNRAMHDNAASQQRLPETSDAVAQYLLLFEMAGSDSEFERLVTYDYSVGRMQAMTRDIRPGQYREIEAEIERLKAEHLPAGAQLYPSGESPVWQTASKVLIGTLVRSLFLAMPIIFLVTSVAFRSAKLGLISALPNLLPITVGLGLLAPLDITLRFSTITAFPIAFGLAIDDTIHFLARYRLELTSGRSVEEAIRRTMATTGRAMFLTSALLVGGFSILFASNFLGIIHIALLNCIILIAALFGDLLLLPALLVVFRPRIPLPRGQREASLAEP